MQTEKKNIDPFLRRRGIIFLEKKKKRENNGLMEGVSPIRLFQSRRRANTLILREKYILEIRKK